MQRLGEIGLGALESLGRFFTILRGTLYWVARRPFDGREWTRQMIRVGVDSIPVVAFTALFTGMVLALQTYNGFARFNATGFVGSIVAISLTRELGPVLTALMIAGRIGSSLAAEIGSMRVTEQIDALEAMATEPVHYLVVPRVAAATLMLPPLAALANGIGIWGGYLVAVRLLGANPVVYWDKSFQYLEMNDLASGLVKAAVFGLILGVTGCAKGFYTTGGAEGVGRSTTEAVVMASLGVLMANFFITKLFF